MFFSKKIKGSFGGDSYAGRPPKLVAPVTTSQESSVDYLYSLDLLCQGPIEGFVNKNGAEVSGLNVLQATYFNESPVLEEALPTAEFCLNPNHVFTKENIYPKINTFNYPNCSVDTKLGSEFQDVFEDFKSGSFQTIINQRLLGPYESGLGNARQGSGNIDTRQHYVFDLADPGVPLIRIDSVQLNFKSNFEAKREEYSYTHMVRNSEVVVVEPVVMINQLYDTIASDADRVQYLHEKALTDTEASDVSAADDIPSVVLAGESIGTRIETRLTVLVEVGLEDQEPSSSFTYELDGLIQGEPFVRDLGQINLPSSGNANRFVRFSKLEYETDSILIKRDVSLLSVNEKTNLSFTYPFSSLTSTVVDARTFEQPPTRTFDVKMKKVRVPSNYQPTQGDGVDIRYVASAESFSYRKDLLKYNGKTFAAFDQSILGGKKDIDINFNIKLGTKSTSSTKNYLFDTYNPQAFFHSGKYRRELTSGEYFSGRIALLNEQDQLKLLLGDDDTSLTEVQCDLSNIGNGDIFTVNISVVGEEAYIETLTGGYLNSSGSGSMSHRPNFDFNPYQLLIGSDYQMKEENFISSGSVFGNFEIKFNGQVEVELDGQITQEGKFPNSLMEKNGRHAPVLQAAPDSVGVLALTDNFQYSQSGDFINNVPRPLRDDPFGPPFFDPVVYLCDYSHASIYFSKNWSLTKAQLIENGIDDVPHTGGVDGVDYDSDLTYYFVRTLNTDVKRDGTVGFVAEIEAIYWGVGAYEPGQDGGIFGTSPVLMESFIKYGEVKPSGENGLKSIDMIRVSGNQTLVSTYTNPELAGTAQNELRNYHRSYPNLKYDFDNNPYIIYKQRTDTQAIAGSLPSQLATRDYKVSILKGSGDVIETETFYQGYLPDTATSGASFSGRDDSAAYGDSGPITIDINPVTNKPAFFSSLYLSDVSYGELTGSDISNEQDWQGINFNSTNNIDYISFNNFKFNYDGKPAIVSANNSADLIYLRNTGNNNFDHNLWGSIELIKPFFQSNIIAPLVPEVNLPRATTNSLHLDFNPETNKPGIFYRGGDLSITTLGAYNNQYPFHLECSGGDEFATGRQKSTENNWFGEAANSDLWYSLYSEVDDFLQMPLGTITVGGYRRIGDIYEIPTGFFRIGNQWGGIFNEPDQTGRYLDKLPSYLEKFQKSGSISGIRFKEYQPWVTQAFYDGNSDAKFAERRWLQFISPGDQFDPTIKDMGDLTDKTRAGLIDISLGGYGNAWSFTKGGLSSAKSNRIPLGDVYGPVGEICASTQGTIDFAGNLVSEFAPIRGEYFPYFNSFTIPSFGPKTIIETEVDTADFELAGRNYQIYEGDWDGSFKLAWTDNPAWILYDLMINPIYGIGNNLDDFNDIDIFSLYKIGRYCDAVNSSGLFEGLSDFEGGLEPRFSCNILLEQSSNAFEMLNGIASSFFGVAYWSNGTINFYNDQPQVISDTFSNNNVFDGIFNYETIEKNAMLSKVEVPFEDKTDEFKLKVESVENEDRIRKFGIIKHRENSRGFTSRSQARRFAKHILYSNILETEMVSFECGRQGLSVMPGDVIRIDDELKKFQINHGKVLNIDSSQQSISVTNYMNTGSVLTGQNGGLYINTPSGQTGKMELYDIANFELGNITNELIDSYEAPQLTKYFITGMSETANEIKFFVDSTVGFDKIAKGSNFSVKVEAEENELFKVISIQPSEDNRYKILAKEHNTGKFDLIESEVQEVDRTETPINIGVKENVVNTPTEPNTLLFDTGINDMGLVDVTGVVVGEPDGNEERYRLSLTFPNGSYQTKEIEKSSDLDAGFYRSVFEFFNLNQVGTYNIQATSLRNPESINIVTKNFSIPSFPNFSSIKFASEEILPSLEDEMICCEVKAKNQFGAKLDFNQDYYYDVDILDCDFNLINKNFLTKQVKQNFSISVSDIYKIFNAPTSIFYIKLNLMDKNNLKDEKLVEFKYEEPKIVSVKNIDQNEFSKIEFEFDDSRNVHGIQVFKLEGSEWVLACEKKNNKKGTIIVERSDLSVGFNIYTKVKFKLLHKLGVSEFSDKEVELRFVRPKIKEKEIQKIFSTNDKAIDKRIKVGAGVFILDLKGMGVVGQAEVDVEINNRVEKIKISGSFCKKIILNSQEQYLNFKISIVGEITSLTTSLYRKNV